MNRELLKKVIEDSGIPKTVISERIGMPYRTFISKVDGGREWNVSEAVRFCDVLRVPKPVRDKIFFCPES